MISIKVTLKKYNKYYGLNIQVVLAKKIQKRFMFSRFKTKAYNQNMPKSKSTYLDYKRQYINNGEDPEDNKNFFKEPKKGHYLDLLEGAEPVKDVIATDKDIFTSIITKNKGSVNNINRNTYIIEVLKKKNKNFTNLNEDKIKEVRKSVDVVIQHPGFSFNQLLLLLTGNRTATHLDTINNDGLFERVNIYVMLNYMNGLETLNFDLLLKIHNYYNFLAVYARYRDRMQYNYNKEKKMLEHKENTKQLLEPSDYENFINYQRIIDFNDNIGYLIINRLNNTVLYDFLPALDFTEFRELVGFSSDYTDQDLSNILLFIMSFRCTSRDNSNLDDLYYLIVNAEENKQFFNKTDIYNFKEKETLYVYNVEGTGIISINELSLLFSKETIINKNVNLFQIGLFDNFNFYEEFVNQCNSDFDHFIEVIHHKLQNEF